MVLLHRRKAKDEREREREREKKKKDTGIINMFNFGLLWLKQKEFRSIIMNQHKNKNINLLKNINTY